MIRYEKYKPSEIEWLGNIPNDWEVNRCKNVFFEVSNLSKNGEEILLTVSHITGVTPRSEKNVNMFLAQTNEGYKICTVGDLLINTMWAWMGALGTSRYDGICSPAYNVYRKNVNVPFDHRYFDYLFKTSNFITEMTRYSKGIVNSRLRLYPKDFFQIMTILPKQFEQTQIANYLDIKTQAIDKKTNLLTQKANYYKEYRKSLINETVCKGLDKNVILEDSGVNWLDKIPNGWKIKRIKDCYNIFTGNSISDKGLHENKTDSIDYVATKDIDIETGNINYDNGVYIQLTDKSFKIAKANSTLICIEGGSAGKKIGFTQKDVCFVNKLCAIKSLNNKNFDKYFFYFTQSVLFEKQFFSILNGLIGGVSLSSIKYFDIILPKINEQKKIADYLDQKTQTIDKIVSNINTQIETLKELRKTLINDAVTGKIKVVS